MGEFRDYLNIVSEMSIAGYGDWEPSKEMLVTMSTFVLNKRWTFVNKIKIKTLEYSIYKLKDEFIMGNIITSSTGEKQFEIDLKIKLMEHKGIANELNIHKRLMNVDGVKVNESVQGLGLATAMYTYLVKNEKMIILGDEIQYFGARRLWAKLSKKLDLTVDIVDVSKGIYLERDVLIHHGLEDWEFDSRVWDYTTSKKHIRLILKEIK
jgi:hypothetical protein